MKKVNLIEIRILLISLVLLAIGLTVGDDLFSSSEDYKVGPGDIISVSVWDEPDLSGDFKISQTGTLIMNWLEPIDINGLKIDEVRTRILEVLGKKYIKSPRITAISIREYASNKVSLMGEVKKPGDYKIDPDTTLLKVILEAGGPSGDASDTVIVLRKGEVKEESTGQEPELVKESYNISQLMTAKDPSKSVKLSNGDVIYIPTSKGLSEAGSAETGVTVLGAVNKIGVYRYREGYTAMNAIIDAGGFTKYASKNRTSLIRGKGKDRKTMVVKMGDVMEKGDKKKDVVLEPGDILIVKEGFL
jgi:polysaccharide biosynthesis/export protein